jgi:GNAT superfamily N-acetyltransferase
MDFLDIYYRDRYRGGKSPEEERDARTAAIIDTLPNVTTKQWPSDSRGRAAKPDGGGSDGRGFEIREIRPDEHAELGEVTVTAYIEAGETDEPYYPELRDVGTRAALVPVLVAVDRATGDILGGVTYVPGPGPYHEGEFGDDASFRMLAVRGDARGRGVGRALVQACIDRARADGRPAIGIVTRPFMTAAHRLYESFGFERYPKADWEFEPGQWLLGYRLRL